MHQDMLLMPIDSYKRISELVGSVQKQHCWVDPPKVWFLLDSILLVNIFSGTFLKTFKLVKSGQLGQ